MIAITLFVLLTPLFVLLVWLAVEDWARRTRRQRAARPQSLPIEATTSTPATVAEYSAVSDR